MPSIIPILRARRERRLSRQRASEFRKRSTLLTVGMILSLLSAALIIVCVIMAITAGLIYWVTALGSPWTVPWAAIRAAVQLAAVASGCTD